MNETFYMEESARPPHPNNCPPGHSIAIANGGKGHWNGDGCCNSSPTASISFIIPFLLITAILIINFLAKKLENNIKNLIR